MSLQVLFLRLATLNAIIHAFQLTLLNNSVALEAYLVRRNARVSRDPRLLYLYGRRPKRESTFEVEKFLVYTNEGCRLVFLAISTICFVVT